jgi:hypothetical protein
MALLNEMAAEWLALRWIRRLFLLPIFGYLQRGSRYQLGVYKELLLLADIVAAVLVVQAFSKTLRHISTSDLEAAANHNRYQYAHTVMDFLIIMRPRFKEFNHMLTLVQTPKPEQDFDPALLGFYPHPDVSCAFLSRKS